MSVYTKLSEARAKFHAMKLEKTGHNKFAGYNYFELGDFIIPALQVFKECELLGVVSFGKDMATLTIVDLETSEKMVIESPMSTAALKGCHEVQNLGAVETYIRRYLWVAALEIVEHDAIDSSKPIDKSPVHTPVQPVGVSDKRMSMITDVAEAVKDRFAQDDIVGAYEEASGITDSEEKQALWKMLDSKIRSALKRHGDLLKEQS